MRILLICGSSYGIGTFVRVREFAKWLNEFGHDVTLMYQGDLRFKPARNRRDGVLEIGVPSFMSRLDLDTMASPIGSIWVLNYIRKHPVDVIHGFEHYRNVHVAGRYSARRWGSVYISDWADWFSIAHRRRLFRVPGYQALMAKREERVKQEADGVTVISHVLKKRALDLGCSEENVLYLPGGAPVDRITPVDRGVCRTVLNLPQDVNVFGYLGSFLSEELIPYLLAFKEISEESDCRFLIVGKTNPVLQRFVEEHGLSELVLITGYIPDEELNHYLGACDVLMLPLSDTAYNRSRWPNKIGDYMAAGRPVICSNIGEMQEVMRTYKIGFAIEEGVTNIVNALEYYTTHLIERDEHGATAREVAEHEFSWESLTRRLESFYLEVASRNIH